jgi:gliotoxin/aspirochlorine biosynthesis thioredoxin reductase
MPKIYDALIIGGGPAGLSVALGLGRVHRTCLVFNDDKFRNQGAYHSHNVLTRDHVPPAEIRALGRKDLERYGNTTFAETRVTKISRQQVGSQQHFLASNAEGQQWQGRSVVLAAGVRDQFPDLEGYAENWPNSIYQCPFCDGHERSDGPIGLLLYPEFGPMAKSATLLHFLSHPVGTAVQDITSSNVTVFTNSPLNPSNDMHAQMLELCAAHSIKVDQRPVLRLEPAGPDAGTGKPGLYVHLQTSDGGVERIYQNFLLHKPATTPSCPELIEQLGLELQAGPFGQYLKVAIPFNSTNVKGVYAAGDVSVMMTAVTNAMLTGAAVAGGVAHHVADLDDEIVLERYRKKKLGDKNATGEVNAELRAAEEKAAVAESSLS